MTIDMTKDELDQIHAVTAEIGTIFTWDYERSRVPLMKLYEKAKTSQWNASTDLDWSIDVDPEKVADELGQGGTARFQALAEAEGSPVKHFGDKEWRQVGVELQNSLLSQFMHGEQGALLCTARIVETVPWIDAKYYAATQVVDEARHVEVFARYLDEKLGTQYGINENLKGILDDILSDPRWDIAYLGMQIMVEGLALAAFGLMQQITTEPLLKKLLRYVMSDEARHVAFGVLSLQEFYKELTDAEMRERQEFAFDVARRLATPVRAHRDVGAHGRRPRRDLQDDGDGEPARPADLPAAVVLEDRAELQEARPARRGRRLAPPTLHRDRRHPVRGLRRHRRGVRVARRSAEGPRHVRVVRSSRSRRTTAGRGSGRAASIRAWRRPTSTNFTRRRIGGCSRRSGPKTTPTARR